MKSEQDTFDELKYNIEIDELGHKLYRNKEGELHRDEGPAIVSPNGYVEYYLNGTFFVKEEYDLLTSNINAV
jgi:hypothetical protein